MPRIEQGPRLEKADNRDMPPVTQIHKLSMAAASFGMLDTACVVGCLRLMDRLSAVAPALVRRGTSEGRKTAVNAVEETSLVSSQTEAEFGTPRPVTFGGESVSRAVYGRPPCFALRATLAELVFRLALALLCTLSPSRYGLRATFARGSCAANSMLGAG